ncbi:hypothetical protein WOC76_12505 [Methylocystis sp. IM3]|uniref:hypothetical protein n=1 Tax=unclassified Methylocystis TaxID=2625913 RepID=UPI0030F973F0
MRPFSHNGLSTGLLIGFIQGSVALALVVWWLLNGLAKAIIPIADRAIARIEDFDVDIPLASRAWDLFERFMDAITTKRG